MTSVVVYRIGSLGDTVVALPCFNKIAEVFPDARRIALTNVPVSAKAPPLAAVLGQTTLIHDFINYPIGVRSPGAVVELWRKLRALRSKTLIYLMPNRGSVPAWRDLAFFRSAGFSEVIGFPHSSDLRLGRLDPETGTEEPEAARLARCLADLGPFNLADPKCWDLHLSTAEREASRRMLAPLTSSPYLVINMGGKALEKDWGLENWARLVDRLKPKLPEAGLVAIGAGEDFERAETLLSRWSAPTVNSCGLLSPRESAAVLERANLFVGHDSGPLHLAAAVGAPSVGVFGDYNRPRKWHPIGDSVSVIHDMRGIASITVDEVEKVVNERIAEMRFVSRSRRP